MATHLQGQLCIPADKVGPAWDALKKVYEELNNSNDWESEDDQFIHSFIEMGIVNDSDAQANTTIHRLSRACFEAGFDGAFDNGSLSSITACNDEWNNEENEAFWDILAPFIEEGSYVIGSAYDGTLFRWRFENGQRNVDLLHHIVWESDRKPCSVIDGRCGACIDCDPDGWADRAKEQMKKQLHTLRKSHEFLLAMKSGSLKSDHWSVDELLKEMESLFKK